MQGRPKQKLGLSAQQVRERFVAFAGVKCSIQNSGANITDPAIHILRNKHFPSHGSEMSTDPEYLATGTNSGFQALNLALLAGAARVILLGYDCNEPTPGADTHWFGDHPTATALNVFEVMRKAFKAAVPSIKVPVLNCSPGTAITAFPRMPLADALLLAHNNETE